MVPKGQKEGSEQAGGLQNASTSYAVGHAGGIRECCRIQHRNNLAVGVGIPDVDLNTVKADDVQK